MAGWTIVKAVFLRTIMSRCLRLHRGSFSSRRFASPVTTATATAVAFPKSACSHPQSFTLRCHFPNHFSLSLSLSCKLLLPPATGIFFFPVSPRSFNGPISLPLPRAFLELRLDRVFTATAAIGIASTTTNSSLRRNSSPKGEVDTALQSSE